MAGTLIIVGEANDLIQDFAKLNEIEIVVCNSEEDAVEFHDYITGGQCSFYETHIPESNHNSKSFRNKQSPSKQQRREWRRNQK